MDVAAGLILDRGIEAVTMEGVAAAAGVSKGLGYAYFANREELIIALLEREVNELERRGNDAVLGQDTFEQRVAAVVGVWFDHVEERGVLLGSLLEGHPIKGELERRRSKYYRRLEEAWGGLIEDELGMPRKTAITAASIYIGGLGALLDRWVNTRADRHALERTYVQLVMAGLGGLAEATQPVRARLRSAERAAK